MAVLKYTALPPSLSSRDLASVSRVAKSLRESLGTFHTNLQFHWFPGVGTPLRGARNTEADTTGHPRTGVPTLQKPTE